MSAGALRLARWVVAAAALPGLALAADAPYPGGAAAYVVEVNGVERWTRAEDRPLPPASLTKIMTALLYLESGIPHDTLVTVGANPPRATGTRLRLRAGERLRAGDLLAATLIASANDACLALAEHVAGDKARFAERMNLRARELGMTRTHFTNPCGHDEPGHRASARDLLTLTREALRQPAFAELVATVQRRVTSQGGRHFDLVNGNELLGRQAGVAGVKSGYTPRAGKCLIVMARRDGVVALVVALNAPDRWWDTAALLDRVWPAATRAPAGAGR